MRPLLLRMAYVLAAAVLAAAVLVAPVTEASAAGDHPVDPFVGTGGAAPWFSGNTTPAATLPFGMVQLGPDTTSDAETGGPSTSASGYAATDPLLRGFSSTHLSGAGCPALGEAPVLPVVGAVPPDPGAATVPIDKASERAGPGRYAVALGNGVRASMAAAARGGLLRFEYPVGRRSRVLVKAADSLGGINDAQVSFPSDREIEVRAIGGGFCGAPNRYAVYLTFRFDSAFRSRGTWGAGAWVGFGRDPVVRLQIGISFVDAAGARRNLVASDVGWSVGKLADRAGAVWTRQLSRVETTGGSAAEADLLQTALYHALLHPTTISDADGRYPGFDSAVHRLPPGERQLSAVSGWDFYRTQLPLLAWLRPDVASEVVRSLRRDAQQAGWLPRWPLVGAETGVMNGDSAAPIVATAYAFGARDFPLDDLVTRLARQGDTIEPEVDQGWFRPRPGLAEYLRLGYVPNTEPERGWPQPHGASTTLEYALDDFAVARLARAAGRTALAARYLARSGSWRSLLDSGRGLLLPRDGGGAFPGPDIDVTACCNGFQEGNAVQYTWGGVPHDMAGLLTSLGPAGDVSDRLDDFFTHLNDGAGRPFAWLGNQPTLATPWAYHWLGQPARTQDVVDRARAELWSATPGGLPGNDDLGALSAWYVWTSLGLYPITPGTANVAVGVPAFASVVVRPSRGVATRIVRSGAGAHVAGLRLDGAARTRSWLDLAPDARPDRIAIATTDATDPVWGTGTSDVPPSYPSR